MHINIQIQIAVIIDVVELTASNSPSFQNEFALKSFNNGIQCLVENRYQISDLE